MTRDERRRILASLTKSVPHLAGEHVVLVQWGNPYTEPPNGKPRELGLVIAKPWETFFPLGLGWCTAFLGRIGEVPREPKRWAPERKGAMRRRNLERRMERRAPLFAADLVAAELAANPSYFSGE